MGCFNVACTVSGISMYCDEALLIPLVQLTDFKYLVGSMLVSNEGPKMFFAPLTLPLFGKLDTYGRLENIVRDANVECIEKYFGMNIDAFANEVTDAWRQDETEKIDLTTHFPDVKNKVISGMWVHRKIWNAMIKSCPGEGKWQPDHWSIWGAGDITPHVLGLIGFKFAREDLEQKRYNRLFTNPKFPEVEIWSDLTWIRCVINGKEHQSLYNLGKLVTLIEKQTKRAFPDRLKNKLKKTPQELVHFDEAITEYVDNMKDPKPWSHLIDFRLGQYFSLLPFVTSGGREFFKKLYGERVADLKDLVVNFRTFEANLGATNRFYCPTTNHYQHGNHPGHLMIAEETVKILQKKVREG